MWETLSFEHVGAKYEDFNPSEDIFNIITVSSLGIIKLGI